MNRLHDLVSGEALARQLLLINAPDTTDVFAVLWVLDVPVARKLIALVPVLASALSVPLARDGGVTAVRLADATGRQHEIDAGQHVLDALALMFNAARVQQKTGFGRPPPFRGLQDFLLHNAGGALGPFEIVGLD